MYRAVHPRVYGEYLIVPHYAVVPHGSSPRVRGILDQVVRFSLFIRFIPACTGNTSWHQSVWARLSVHPRVYGEYDAKV